MVNRGMEKSVLTVLGWCVGLSCMAAPPPVAAPPSGTDDGATFAGNAAPQARYLRLGELALENDDPEAAADFLRRALAALKDPETRRRAVDLLHESLLATHRVEDADKVLADAEKSPDFTTASDRLELMRARRLIYTGQPAAAVEKLHQLSVQLRPDDNGCRRTLELLAGALNAAGDFTGAEKRYADLAAVAGNDGLWRLKALEGATLNALDAKRVDQAKKLFSRIAREVPPALQNEFQPRLQKIQWLIEASDGQFPAIEAQYRAWVAKARPPDPLLARIAAAGARFRLSEHKNSDAIDLWRSAFRLAEESFRPAALRGLIDAEYAGGDAAGALKSLEHYFELFPNAPDRDRLMLFAAGLDNRLNRTAEAGRLYRKVFDSPDAASDLRCEAAIELAKLAQRTGNAQEAVSMFKFAISATTDLSRQRKLAQNLGEYLYLLGRYPEALSFFAALAADTEAGADGENAQLWQAQTLYQLKKFDEALPVSAKLSGSGNAELRRKADYLNALLLEKLSRTDEAVKCYLDFVQRYPTSKEAATALFQAGELALTTPNYSAPEIFTRFAAAYPGENAANALYKAQGELLIAGDAAAAEKLLTELDSKYPDSKYTVGAHFRKVDFLRESGRAADALSALDELGKRFTAKNPELQAEILYDRAILCDALRDGAGAQAALNDIIGRYADKPIAPQAFFMLGDLKARNGDFAAAAALFRQAEERKPGGDFAAACAGRAADAAYGIYAKTRQERYLKQAMTGYETLLKSPTLPPALRFQTMYKLGRCAGDANDGTRALKLYRELLYSAALAKREKRFYAPVWSAKALNAALDLLLPAAADASSVEQAAALRREAVRLLNVGGELDLPGENIAGRLEKLQDKNW